MRRSNKAFRGIMMAAASLIGALGPAAAAITPNATIQTLPTQPRASSRIKRAVWKGGNGMLRMNGKIGRRYKGRDHISSPAQQRLAKRRKAARKARTR